MKKIIVAMVIAIVALQSFARGPGCHPGGWGHHPGGPGWGHHPGWGPHHGGGWWGRGGCNFWPGFVGGVIGASVANSYYHGCYPAWPARAYTTPVVTTPVVTTTPVYTTPVVTTTPVYTTPVVTTQPVVYPTVVQPTTTYSSTTVINATPPPATPLVGAGVNVLGVRVGVGVGY